jgi:hypothetical protein
MVASSELGPGLRGGPGETENLWRGCGEVPRALHGPEKTKGRPAWTWATSLTRAHPCASALVVSGSYPGQRCVSRKRSCPVCGGRFTSLRDLCLACVPAPLLPVHPLRPGPAVLREDLQQARPAAHGASSRPQVPGEPRRGARARQAAGPLPRAESDASPSRGGGPAGDCPARRGRRRHFGALHHRGTGVEPCSRSALLEV